VRNDVEIHVVAEACRRVPRHRRGDLREKRFQILSGEFPREALVSERGTGGASEIRAMTSGARDVVDCRPALAEALASSGPALVDVVTDPNVLAMPPKATVQQAKGFALAMTKMAFTGELEDVLDTVMANWRELG